MSARPGRPPRVEHDDELQRAFDCLEGDGCRWRSTTSTNEPPSMVRSFNRLKVTVMALPSRIRPVPGRS